MPCVICGDAGDIEIDHIVPVKQGGSSARDNLQPLCSQCHHRKGRNAARSNAELTALYLEDPTLHHQRNLYRLAVCTLNRFDAPTFAQWKARQAGEGR